MCELDNPCPERKEKGIKGAARAIGWDKEEKGGTRVAYQEDRLQPGTPHQVVLEDREQLMISGVEEVESFDENSILLSTSQGDLEVQGEGLHIEKLSLDGGDLKVEGLVNALIYQPRSRERGGLLSRLLGG